MLNQVVACAAMTSGRPVSSSSTSLSGPIRSIAALVVSSAGATSEGTAASRTGSGCGACSPARSYNPATMRRRFSSTYSTSSSCRTCFSSTRPMIHRHHRGAVRIRVAHSGRCVDVWDASQDATADATQYTCSATNFNQQFAVEPTGTGSFKLRARHSGQCLEIAGRGLANKAKLHQNWCVAHRAQEWVVG
ncbi:ricin-type beta-trefoil lectin protein [Lentzea atacamensis]|uniref:Ricin-type beta-trefoil lectin protein n=2 Tax=Lentzea atacamensis TaxID=531938 RepID=A0A316I7Q9_9PSEU|nr:ricin-type beta-trefoil lectin protein [Lentzea atacamensis]